eukprot:GCRY01002015.1.p1 GENE.GCRY01002015.1~~GCRY01002015.1.p1  ORF type:complete len:296 (+),score=76.59 GCRY01002015.1:93-980(+)
MKVAIPRNTTLFQETQPSVPSSCSYLKPFHDRTKTAKPILREKELVLWTSKLPFSLDPRVEIREGLDRALYYRSRGRELPISYSNSSLNEVCQVPESKIKGTLKIVVNEQSCSSSVSDAIEYSLSVLGRESLHLGLLAVDGISCEVPTDALPESFLNLYAELEKSLTSRHLQSIGVANLSATQLQHLSQAVKIPPAVDQVRALPTANPPHCPGAETLLQYAAAEGVQLTTHSDPSFDDLLPPHELKKKILRYYDVEGDFDVVVRWITKYTFIDTNTQVIKDRGYLVKAVLTSKRQ